MCTPTWHERGTTLQRLRLLTPGSQTPGCLFQRVVYSSLNFTLDNVYPHLTWKWQYSSEAGGVDTEEQRVLSSGRTKQLAGPNLIQKEKVPQQNSWNQPNLIQKAEVLKIARYNPNKFEFMKIVRNTSLHVICWFKICFDYTWNPYILEFNGLIFPEVFLVGAKILDLSMTFLLLK